MKLEINFVQSFELNMEHIRLGKKLNGWWIPKTVKFQF